MLQVWVFDSGKLGREALQQGGGVLKVLICLAALCCSVLCVAKWQEQLCSMLCLAVRCLLGHCLLAQICCNRYCCYNMLNSRAVLPEEGYNTDS
jgi:hypothetical protein